MFTIIHFLNVLISLNRLSYVLYYVEHTYVKCIMLSKAMLTFSHSFTKTYIVGTQVLMSTHDIVLWRNVEDISIPSCQDLFKI